MIDPPDDLDSGFDEFMERRSRGERPNPEEYYGRFPSLREDLETLKELESIAPGVRPPVAGRRIGRYRLLRELGSGGMGVVYLAEREPDGARVALKVLRSQLAESVRTIDRFRREAKLPSRLSHASIVPVLEFGEDEGVLFVAMEYVESATLAQVLVRLREDGVRQLALADLRSCVEELLGRSPVPGGNAREEDRRGYFGHIAALTAHLADALSHAHERGVLHRDVKPSNILLRPSLVPALTDFGLAKDLALDGRSSTGEILGTLPYMSPEVARPGRRPVDGRSDVYSLGVTLYEALTLSRPFPGTSLEEVVPRIVAADSRLPSRMNPDVPAPLEAICLKAMAKSPERRYASMRELAEDLRRFLRFEPVRAPSPGLLTEARRFVRRHRRIAAGTLALLGAGTAFAASSQAVSRRARIDSQIAEGRELEKGEEWLAARDVYQRMVHRHGTSVREAVEGLSRVQAILGDLVDSHLRRAAQYRALAKESDLYHYLEASSLEEAYRLSPDPGIARRLDEARGLFSFLVASDPPGAKVTIHPVEEASGRVLDGLPVGETPVLIERVHVGAHRLLVEKAGFGFAEPTILVRRGEEDRQLRVVLRRTEDVTADGMALVPAGTYSIGKPLAAKATPNPSTPRPPAKVRVEAFYIDRTEVSNEAYARFLQATNAEPPGAWRRAGGMYPEGEASLPVRGLSWSSALAYAEWAGKRLPTETEWEVAARGHDPGPDGEAPAYPWGGTFVPRFANVNLTFDLRKPDFGAPVDRPEPVMSRPDGASPFGLLNMVGNVMEWVWDPFVAAYPLPDAFGTYVRGGRVAKGGSWRWPDAPCAARQNLSPEPGYNDCGFRCAKSCRP